MRNISFSQANTFNDCAKQWAYKYLDHAPEKPNPYMAAGKEFHKKIEHHLSNVALFPGTPDLEYAASIAVIDNHMPLLEQEVVAQTMDAEMQKVTVYVKGFVDAIVETNDRRIVVDWKTSQRKPKEMTERYRNQLSLYAYMLDCTSKDTIMLAYPQYQVSFEEQYDPEYGEQVYDHIVDTAYEIEEFSLQVSSAKEVKGTPSRNCKYCSFVDVCEDSFENQKKRLKVN